MSSASSRLAVRLIRNPKNSRCASLSATFTVSLKSGSATDVVIGILRVLLHVRYRFARRLGRTRPGKVKSQFPSSVLLLPWKRSSLSSHQFLKLNDGDRAEAHKDRQRAVRQRKRPDLEEHLGPRRRTNP